MVLIPLCDNGGIMPAVTLGKLGVTPNLIINFAAVCWNISRRIRCKTLYRKKKRFIGIFKDWGSSARYFLSVVDFST
ncbi:hypothetical protein Hdeb2414_s0032g00710301 [Helianthus debilis subsp. tardiflorus]